MQKWHTFLKDKFYKILRQREGGLCNYTARGGEGSNIGKIFYVELQSSLRGTTLLVCIEKEMFWDIVWKGNKKNDQNLILKEESP